MKIAKDSPRFRIASVWRKFLSRFRIRTKTFHVEEWLSLILDDQEARLSLVTSGLTGERQLGQFHTINIQGMTTEEIATRLKAIIDTMKLKAPHLLGIVHSNLAVTRNIEIPSQDTDEIREILSLQASRHTPYARNEIIIDYINLGVFKSVYTKVLFIIVPRSAVLRYFELATRLNLKVDKVLFNPEATAQFLGKDISLSNEKAPICIVHLDSFISEFLIVSRGLLLFVRSIPVGAKHLTAAKEGYSARFLEELKKSIETYQGENIDLMPTQMLLVGATKMLDDMTQEIQETLKLTVKRISELDVVPMEAPIRERVEFGSVSLLPLSVPAVLADKLSVDLTPEENKLRKALTDRTKEIVKTAILGMVLLGLVCIMLISHIYFKSAQIQQLSKRFKPIEKEADMLEKAYIRVRAIKSHLAMRGKAIEAFAELSSFLSDDLYLTEIKFDAEGKLNIKGTAYLKNSIFSLVDKIESSPLFRNVQTKYITGRLEEDREVADFELSASME